MQVGHDLTAGRPGHFGVVTVEAFGGDFNLTVLSGQKSVLAAGSYIDLDGEAYEIESVGLLNETITLVEVRITKKQNYIPCNLRKRSLNFHPVCCFMATARKTVHFEDAEALKVVTTWLSPTRDTYPQRRMQDQTAITRRTSAVLFGDGAHPPCSLRPFLQPAPPHL